MDSDSEISKQNGFSIIDEYKNFLPLDYNELRASLLLYILSPDFRYPVNTEIFFENFFSNFQKMNENEKEIIEELRKNTFKKILDFFERHEILEFRKQLYGFEIKDFIVDVDKENLIEFCKEFYKDRPKKKIIPEMAKEDNINKMIEEFNQETIQISTQKENFLKSKFFF